MIRLRPYLVPLVIVATIGFVPGPGVAAETRPATHPSHGLREVLATARDHLRACRFAEAESLARIATADAERRHGPSSLQAAEALEVLAAAMVFHPQRTPVEAREPLERALAIRGARQGPDHPDVASDLLLLTRILVGQFKTDSAERVGMRAVEIRRKRFGPESPRVASALLMLCLVDARRQDYERELERAGEALRILGRTRDVDSLDVAYAIAARADALLGMGRPGDQAEARAGFLSAIRLMEKHLGPDHPDIPVRLINVALSFRFAEDYATARRYNDEAILRLERVLGPDHPGLGPALVNQGRVLADLGDWAGARRLAERALAIREKHLPPDHALIGSALGMLVYALDGLGEYEQALPHSERMVRIARNAPGRDSLELRRYLDIHADLLMSLGRFREARSFQEEGLAIATRRQGPSHPNTVWFVQKLADGWANEDSLDRALGLYARAAAAQETTAARTSLARTLHRMGRALRRAGLADSARACQARALALNDSVLGRRSSASLACNTELAILDYQAGRRTQALERALELERDAREQLRLNAPRLAEREALGFEEARATGLDLALAMAGDSIGLDAAARRSVWDALVRSRALVFDNLADRRRRLRGDRPDVARRVAALDSARWALATTILRGPAGQSPQEYEARVAEARRAREAAERSLGDVDAAFAAEQALERTGLDSVLARLPRDAALLAFARPRPRRASGTRPDTGPDGYLAFVLPPGASDPLAIHLGRTSEVEGLIADWRRSLASPPGPAGIRAAERRCRVAGERVRTRLWDPIARHLVGARRVFVVPDGAFQGVNLAALPTTGGRYLAESGPPLHLLATERDLVAGNEPTPGDGLLAMGGPDFDRRPEPGAEPMAAAVAAAPRQVRSSLPASVPASFGPLPGASAEATEIAALWTSDGIVARGPALTLVGDRATEEAFKGLSPGRRVLHLATHGFVLGEASGEPFAAAGARGVGGIVPGEDGALASARRPEWLSGLTFAGVNRRNPAGVGDDGFLTHEEILSLDLSSVEWAVLSGCGTGVGRTTSVESIQGLHRAFRVAGARTVVMSLWAVDDQGTREWMIALYRARLQGRSTLEAVHEARRAVLAARRERGDSTHPFHWAAFVAAGDWR